MKICWESTNAENGRVVVLVLFVYFLWLLLSIEIVKVCGLFDVVWGELLTLTKW